MRGESLSINAPFYFLCFSERGLSFTGKQGIPLERAEGAAAGRSSRSGHTVCYSRNCSQR